MIDYPMRSLMFVPGHRQDLMVKSASSEADVLLLDLEDSVQPETKKDDARKLIIGLLDEGLFRNRKIYIRVNDRESGHLLKDIQLLAGKGIEGFVYPKSTNGQDIYFIDKLIETIEYEKGLPLGRLKIIPLIETAGAVLNADDICKASNRVTALAYGSEDFINDLNGVHDEKSESLFVPRAMIAMAARANDIIPIDTVHVRVHDLEDLRQNLTTAKNLGFEGMLVLNPKELELVHHFFSPTDKEVKNAQEMIDLSKKAIEEGDGVAVKNNKFIGPPLVARARKVIQKHNLIKNKNV